jgi:hypothetical protein
LEVSGQLHAPAALPPEKEPLDVVVKRKIPNPCQESNPRTLIIQPIAQCYMFKSKVDIKIVKGHH